MNVTFLGSPQIAADLLTLLLNDNELEISINQVVTRPDRPVGRKKIMTPTPVKEVAQEHTIPVAHELTPEIFENTDLAVVFAYGTIIPQDILSIPKHGFWNVHPSLLPLFRGASPVNYEILMGNEQTGCTLMLLDSQMDHGPIIEQKEMTIDPQHTTGDHLNKAVKVGYEMLHKNIAALSHGELDLNSLPVQNDSLATFTRPLKKDDGFLPVAVLRKALNKERLTTEELPLLMQQFLSQNTVQQYPIPYAPYIVYNVYRALHPWPGIWTEIQHNGAKKRLKINRLHLENDELIIEKVQLEGKTEVDFKGSGIEL